MSHFHRDHPVECCRNSSITISIITNHSNSNNCHHLPILCDLHLLLLLVVVKAAPVATFPLPSFVEGETAVVSFAVTVMLTPWSTIWVDRDEDCPVLNLRDLRFRQISIVVVVVLPCIATGPNTEEEDVAPVTL